ncbi:MAG TPA: adenosine deaminase [Actinomycetota bacterium]|nr:adenosine deaminase [Actinomycetota bacterium]
MATLDEALARLPKAELHCHIEGTMRPATVVELARKNGVELPAEDPEELYRYTSLDSFLEVFWLVQACLADRADWARLAYESLVEAAEHGVVYRETFFTPARHLAAGQRLADIVAGLEEGLEAAERETGARAMLIAGIDKAYGGEAGRQLVEELIELKRSGGAERVIGIGMDSTEQGNPPSRFVDAYRLAAGFGLRRTGHQGETTEAGWIRDALDGLGLERIDHGIRVLDEPGLVRRLAEEGLPFTVCPTSNVRIANAVDRLEDHPFPSMRDAGLHVTINTDDPAMIDLDPAREYAACARAFGYGFDDMVRIARAAFEAAWLSAAERADLLKRLDRDADLLRREMARAG